MRRCIYPPTGTYYVGHVFFFLNELIRFAHLSLLLIRHNKHLQHFLLQQTGIAFGKQVLAVRIWSSGEKISQKPLLITRGMNLLFDQKNPLSLFHCLMEQEQCLHCKSHRNVPHARQNHRKQHRCFVQVKVYILSE